MAEAKDKPTERKVQAGAVTNRPRFTGGSSYVFNNRNANAILRGLQRFEPALGRFVNKYHSRAETTKAEKDFKEGKNAPESASSKYMTVYGKLQGEKKAVEFHNSLDQWLQTNPNAEFGTYEKTKASMLAQHSEGLSGYALDSFLPTAVGSIGKADAKYQDLQIEYLKADASSNISTIAGGKLNDLISGTAPDELPKAMRDDLTRMHKEFKAGPLDKKEMSQSYLRAIGQRAEVEGRPELLDFTNIKDKDGIALIDTDLAEEIRTYKKRAEQNRDDKLKRYKVERAEFIEHKKGELNLAVHGILTDPELKGTDRDVALTALETEFYKWAYKDNNADGYQFNSEYNAGFSKVLRASRSLSGFATNDNGGAIIRLEEAGTDISLEQIANEIPNITKDTYVKYMGKLGRITKKTRSTEGREQLKKENKYFNFMVRGLSFANPFGQIANPYPNASARQMRAFTLWTDWVEEAERKFTDEKNPFLSNEQLEGIASAVKAYVEKEIPTGVEIGVPNIGGKKTPDQKQAEDKKKSTRDKIAGSE
jgi:hypothetical protein